jgi:hypothetical protein
MVVGVVATVAAVGAGCVRVFVGVGGFEVNVELGAGDAGLRAAADMQVVAIELQPAEAAFQFAEINAEVQQRTEEHVAADAAENVEVKGLHGGRRVAGNSGQAKPFGRGAARSVGTDFRRFTAKAR